MPMSFASGTRRRIAAFLVVAAATVGALAGVAPPAAAGVTRVTICHEVGNGSYRVITVSASALVNGHGHHSGDIIPSVTFTRGRQTIHVAGRNLGAIGPQGQLGSDILANGCRMTAVPDSSPAITTPTPSSAPTTASTPTPSNPPTTASTPTPSSAPTTASAATPSNPPTTVPAPTPAPTLAPSPQPTAAPIPQPTAVPPMVPAIPPGQPQEPLAPDVTLTPAVECVVRRDDGVTVVWFDYELSGEQPVRVAWGSGNQLQPSGTPPQLFGPGLHPRVVSVETLDGVATWTLGTETVASDASTPDCEALTSTPPTTAGPDTSAPSDPDTTSPAATVPPHGATTDTVSGSTPDGCAPGQRLVDDDCELLEPIRLVLLDNVIDCSGFGLATFAAVNDNEFALTDDDIESELTPARLDGAQPTRVGIERTVTPEGVEVVETFEVAYVSAVTWRLTHHGLTSTISAGAGGARASAECPLAVLESTGAPGTLPAASSPQLVTVGSTNLPIAIVALVSVLLGLATTIVARRRDHIDSTSD